MERRTKAELWREIASSHLGEPVIASVILTRKGMIRDQTISYMAGGLTPVGGIAGAALSAAVGEGAEAGLEAVAEQMDKRRHLKPIEVHGYAYVAVGATKFGIIKPEELALTTAQALRRGKTVLLVPLTVPIKLTVGSRGIFFRTVLLEVGGFAPTEFRANRRNWKNLQKAAAALLGWPAHTVSPSDT